MATWIWAILALGAGVAIGVYVTPRVRRVIRETPSPELPESLAPGWYACCTRCGRTRTLASVGGIRIRGNRNANKATLGWCRACRGLRIIRIVHHDRLMPPGA